MIYRQRMFARTLSQSIYIKMLIQKLRKYKCQNLAYKLLARICWFAAQFLGRTIPSWEDCGHHGTTSHAASIQRNCCKPQPQIWGLHQQRTTVSTAGCHITQIWNLLYRFLLCSLHSSVSSDEYSKCCLCQLTWYVFLEYVLLPIAIWWWAN
jgi:hypothetical protein